MKLAQVFRGGLFGTGWKNVLIDLVLAMGVYFTNEIYAILNHGPAVINLRTPLDAALPVIPIFVIPYISLQPLVYLTLGAFLLFRTKIFQSACVALMIAFGVSYGFYLFLQSEVLRPTLTGTDLLTQMIRDVYVGDQPYNDFPSLHTSSSVLLAIHWYRWDLRPGRLAAIWAALIVASTVLIKQHYLADVIGGLVLAFAASALSMRFFLPQKAEVAIKR